MAAQSSKGLHVITMPKKMLTPRQKAQMKKKEISLNSKYVDHSKPILTCQNKKLNFYKGQNYGKFDKVPLVTETWMSKKSREDSFIIHKYLENPALVDTPTKVKSFEELGLDDRIVQQLAKNGFTTPTNIQSLAIPYVLDGSNSMIAAETGNGKTLSFVAPIVHQLLNSKHLEQQPVLNSPRALIIVPGRELGIQARDMTRMVACDLGFNVNSVIGGKTKKMLMNPRHYNMDILVGSFGCLSKLVTNRIFSMKRVSHVVLDEADTLLDDTFSSRVSHFLSKFAISDNSDDLSRAFSGIQLTLVGATFPREIDKILKDSVNVASLITVKTPYLHRISPHIKQSFTKINPSKKAEKLLKLAKNNLMHHIPTLIFSNTAPTSNWVSLFLNENGIPCLHLNGAMSFYERAHKFREFQEEKCLFLSCTDIVSRGLDTVRVKHVLNFDFPQFMADYIHRCGRTGRVGCDGDCHVTNFVSKKSEVSLVQKIEYALRKGMNLPSVNANIKHLIGERTKRYETLYKNNKPVQE